MGDESEPAPQFVGDAQGDRGGADRRRSSSWYIISQTGLQGAGVGPIPEAGAAEEDSENEFASTSGDTFPDMIMTLLKQLTGGDDVIDINIYNLLHQAGLDEFLVTSLTSALQLGGEDALAEESTALLETMSISALEVFHAACAPVTVALKETLEAATKYSRTQLNDLIMNSTAEHGNDSQKTLGRLRESEDVKQFRAVYHALDADLRDQ